MASQTATSSVERSRRYRKRQREGYTVVQVPVHDEMVRALVSHNFLAKDDAESREKVAEAVDLLLFCLAEGAVEIDYDHFA